MKDTRILWGTEYWNPFCTAVLTRSTALVPPLVLEESSLFLDDFDGGSLSRATPPYQHHLSTSAPLATSPSMRYHSRPQLGLILQLVLLLIPAACARHTPGFSPSHVVRATATPRPTTRLPHRLFALQRRQDTSGTTAAATTAQTTQQTTAETTAQTTTAATTTAGEYEWTKGVIAFRGLVFFGEQVGDGWRRCAPARRES